MSVWRLAHAAQVSSRSHSVLMLRVSQRHPTAGTLIGNLNLADLAGMPFLFSVWLSVY